MELNRRLAVYLACVAQFIVLLDFSATNIFSSDILRDLKLPDESGFWLMSAFALPYGALLLLGGRLADWIGAVNVVCMGLALSVVGSLLCAIAGNMELFMTARALQGIAAALVSPASLAAVMRLGSSEQERSLSIYGAVSSLGFSAGLIVGGLVGELSGWRWFFMGASMLACITLIPMIKRREAWALRRLPPLSAVMQLATVSFLVTVVIIGLSLMSDAHSSFALAWALVGMGGVGLAILLSARARTGGEIAAVKQVLSRRAAAISVAAAGLIGAAVVPMLLMLSLYQGSLLQFGVLVIALRFLPHGLCCTVLGYRLPQLIEKLGPAVVARIALLFLAAGLVTFSLITPQASYVLAYLPGLLLTAIGIVGGFVALLIMANNAVPENEQGMISALINMSDQLGGAFGLAASALVVTYIGTEGRHVEMFPICLALLAVFPLIAAVLTFMVQTKPSETSQ